MTPKNRCLEDDFPFWKPYFQVFWVDGMTSQQPHQASQCGTRYVHFELLGAVANETGAAHAVLRLKTTNT